MMPPPLQSEGQQVEGGEEDEGRIAKRRRQTDEGAEAEAEGEGRPTAEGAAGAEEAVQGPEMAEAVQQHHDEDSAVQALKQLSDQVGTGLWIHTCVDVLMSELCPPHPPLPTSPSSVASVCSTGAEATVGTGRMGSHLCGLPNKQS